MLQKLIASRLITPPAIWGKLPGHADFVRSGMRHGESEGWQDWLNQQDCLRERDPARRGSAALPIVFVLPPCSLAFAPRRFVVGVITPSLDRVGRHYPLLAYQLAHPRWLKRHFEVQTRQPQDWLFWLSRAVSRHIGELGVPDILALRRTVKMLWRQHEPQWRELCGRCRSDGAAPTGEGGMEALLEKVAGPVPPNDTTAHLHGVRFLPWADWPRSLANPRAQSVFWQQDARGGFVNAATRLQTLWGDPR